MYVANINEASLAVESHGGDIELGKVKASSASCLTEGRVLDILDL